MTIREEAQWCIQSDGMLAEIRKKIRSGKATYEDTAAYSARAGKMIGALLSRRLPEIPPEEREQLCVELLHDRYIDINAAVDAVQRYLDERLGIQLAPQRAPFEEARAHKIGHSTADQTVPEKTQQRRSRAATETMTRSMHDDRMQAEAKFRSRAGLKCFINRVSVNGCCKWCQEVSGRYLYDDAPKGIFRRHDNCDCTVVYDTQRGTRQVLRGTTKKWEVVAEGAGAPEPVRLTAEQAKALQKEKQLHKMSGRSSDIPINAEPIQNSPKDLIALANYARERGIQYHNPMDFDGDIKLMMRQIDAIASIRDEYKITHKLTIRTSKFLGNDLGNTSDDGRTITFNISALRNFEKTNAYLNADNWFSSTSDIGIAIHEMGHVIHKKYGGIGLDIARKTCYNLTGEQMGYQETIEYLFSSISEYSIFLYPNQRDKPFSPKLYREIIPEVLAKHATDPDSFTTEFIRIMKEGCGL